MSEQDQLLNSGGGDGMNSGEFNPGKLLGEQPVLNNAGDMSMDANDTQDSLDDTALSYATADEDFHNSRSFGEEFNESALLAKQTNSENHGLMSDQKSEEQDFTEENELDLEGGSTGAPVTTDDLDEILQGDANLMPTHDIHVPPAPTDEPAVSDMGELPDGDLDTGAGSDSGENEAVEDLDDNVEGEEDDDILDLNIGIGAEEDNGEPTDEGTNELNEDELADNTEDIDVSTEQEDSLLGTEETTDGNTDNHEGDEGDDSNYDQVGETLELAEPVGQSESGEHDDTEVAREEDGETEGLEAEAGDEVTADDEEKLLLEPLDDDDEKEEGDGEMAEAEPDHSATEETELSEEGTTSQEPGTPEQVPEPPAVSEERDTTVEPRTSEEGGEEDATEGDGEEEATMETSTTETEIQQEPAIVDDVKEPEDGVEGSNQTAESMEVGEDNREPAADTESDVLADNDVEMAEPKPEKLEQQEASSETAEKDTEDQNESPKETATDEPIRTESPTIATDSVQVKQELIDETAKETEMEATSIDTEDTTGPKIVGVTSVADAEFEEKPSENETEPPAATEKEQDSTTADSDLGLQIASVSGSVKEATPASKEDVKKEAAEEKKSVPAEQKTPVPEQKTPVPEQKTPVPEQKTPVPEQKTPVPEQKAPVREERRAAARAKHIIRNEAAAGDSDDDVIAIKEEKKPAPPKPKASKIQTCIVCKKLVKCKFNIVRNGDVKHLCEDSCFKKFRSNPTIYLKPTDPSAKTKNGTGVTPAAGAKPNPPAAVAAKNTAALGSQPPVYKTCTVCQLMNVRTSKPFLNWQGLDFCGEECLGKFQGGLSSTCSYCASQINQANRAKFCWRVGNEVKQFCSSPCYNEFVKRLKLCAFCNKDLAQVSDSFMAPVGNMGTFKDFCSQFCLQKYEEKNSRDIQAGGTQKGPKSQPASKGNFTCAVCSKSGPVKHEFKLEGKVNRLCSDPCFSAFQYANKLTMNTCDDCGTSCYGEGATPQYIQYEGQQKRFCSYMCINTFRNSNKKTVPCAWCASKKSNFDMIERVDANNKYQLFCSLNCLSLYRVNLQATSNQAVMCDQCRKIVPAQYHLTMSDASVRNFCSYTCVMTFQAQFTANKQAAATAQPSKVVQQIPPQQQQQMTTTKAGGRMVTRGVTQQQKTQQQTVTKSKTTGRAQSPGSFPIISNVVSLAPQGTQQQINVKSPSGVLISGQQPGIKTTTATTANQTVQQQIVIQPPAPKPMKNKSMLCKPFVQTKATSCRPHTQTKTTQTDGKIEPDKYLIPVPVPLYVPTPLPMYRVPIPIMIPVPVPIPIPVFIPTTKKSAASILKQIKEIREKIPSDPLEAELLMMAEAVAGKDASDSSDSEDFEADAPKAPVPAIAATATASTEGAALGEDMLQMALRMASEMSDEPVMDLENSLEPVAVSSVPPPAPTDTPKALPTPVVEDDDDDDEYTPPSSRSRRGRGAKRQSAGRGRKPQVKRQKVDIPSEMIMHERTPSPQPPAPPPDSNFHLKYTYGVNAWKHWVLQKNAEKEQEQKSSRRSSVKLFKTDVLQCTPDELNFSLVRFVKEVRKPNGEEYAVDSIYYLCLGIQQYLFESSRIDNIFTDAYYEKFTDGLNEILTKYEPKLNHKSQLVCRIEEEHLWESKQLGAHSPHVLLNSLVYFNTKYFMLKTSEDHLKLSFTHIMKHWKKTASGRGSGTGANAGRCVYLRYYCPAAPGETNQKKKKEEMPVYEQTENLDNPLRCPVKLYEFYLSKCPESIKNRNDTFYLVPERSCVPDSPVWYSTAMLGVDYMAKMLNRIRLVREIQEAHLHTQPVFI